MYLLDTNICIYLIKNKFPILKQRLLECNPDEVFVSSITVAEMEYGASKSQYREKNRQAMLNFFSSFGNILDFTTDDTEAYGIIRAYLEKIGKTIGPYDMEIAAQALSSKLTVITNHYVESSRIPGLKAEAWPNE